jgi:hypothetical protein
MAQETKACVAKGYFRTNRIPGVVVVYGRLSIISSLEPTMGGGKFVAFSVKITPKTAFAYLPNRYCGKYLTC